MPIADRVLDAHNRGPLVRWSLEIELVPVPAGDVNKLRRQHMIGKLTLVFLLLLLRDGTQGDEEDEGDQQNAAHKNFSILLLRRLAAEVAVFLDGNNLHFPESS